LLSTWVPFVSMFHLLVYPGTAIYLGLNGYEIAWRNQPYHSLEQMRDREREWVVWGIVLNVVFLLGLLIFLVYLRTFVQEVLEGMQDLGI
jgi:hypothetical protein